MAAPYLMGRPQSQGRVHNTQNFKKSNVHHTVNLFDRWIRNRCFYAALNGGTQNVVQRYT